MKYYIDDKLIRTSKRTYTHAVLLDDKVISCCGDLEKAHKELARRVASHDQSIRDYIAAVKAIDAGKSYYLATLGRSRYKREIEGTRESYTNAIRHHETRKTQYSIRELEAR